MEFVLFQIVILIFSVVLHEVSHGAVAYSLGDTTAKNSGRLTLNPIPHIDLFGSILLPGFLLFASYLSGGGGIILGWAKPVPINPFNFRDQKYGSAKVSLAGPASNLIIALVFGLALRFLFTLNRAEGLVAFLGPGFVLALTYIVQINIVLAVFNLLPIPPLDGSHLLFSLLPKSMEYIKIFLSRYGYFILLFLIFFSFGFISSIVNAIFRLIVGAAI